MTFLALPLLVAGVLADDLNTPVAADHLALLTDFFDARSNLHHVAFSSSGPLRSAWGGPEPAHALAQRPGSSFVSVGDPTSGEVIRGQLNLNFVSGENADVVHSHLAGYVGQNFVAILELNAEHCVRQWLGDRSFQNDRVFFGLGQGSILLGMYRTAAQTWAHENSRRTDGQRDSVPSRGVPDKCTITRPALSRRRLPRPARRRCRRDVRPHRRPPTCHAPRTRR